MARSVYGIVVFMSVATTLLAPPLLKWAWRGATPSSEAPEEVVQIG
jgi:hypothetical protein